MSQSSRKSGTPERSDRITVYRGGNTESTPYDKAYAWTVDINIAYSYAISRGNGPGYLASGVIDRSDIIDISRNIYDMGIFVDPGCVKDVECIEIYGSSFLSEHKADVMPIYDEYSRKIRGLEFAADLGGHDAAHECRVLFLALLIADLLKLDLSDKKILALSAMYHDSGRTNEAVDDDHGRYGRKVYESSVSRPDPIVSFICEYHCLNDMHASQVINSDPLLSRERDRVGLLYAIFKDADALDRVRFGVYGLDLNYLRIGVSRQLGLVARLLLEQTV